MLYSISAAWFPWNTHGNTLFHRARKCERLIILRTIDLRIFVDYKWFCNSKNRDLRWPRFFNTMSYEENPPQKSPSAKRLDKDAVFRKAGCTRGHFEDCTKCFGAMERHSDHPLMSGIVSNCLIKRSFITIACSHAHSIPLDTFHQMWINAFEMRASLARV